MTWTSCFVGDLVARGEAEVKTGPFGTQLHASDYVEHGTPVINVRNIGFGTIRPEKLEFISNETVRRLSTHLLRPKDIVFGRKGAVERHVYIKDKHENWFQGSDCLRLRLLSEKNALSMYLSYCFLTEYHKQWMMQQCSHGATMASLNQDIIKRIPLLLPPLPTQRRIASVLSAYDDLIENNTRRIAILEEIARRLYEEWFVQFRFPGHEEAEFGGGLPKGWQAKELGDLATETRDAVHPSQVPGETPYVGLEHIPRRSITLNDWSTADSVGSSKLLFKRGDILFGKIRPYFHKVVIAPLDGVCSTDTIVLRPKSQRLSSLVLCCASSDAFVKHATQTSNGTKMPRADWKVLKHFLVSVPTTEVLDKFNAFLEPMVGHTRALMFKNANLRAQRDLLLPKLISGEIDVSDLPLPGAEEQAA